MVIATGLFGDLLEFIYLTFIIIYLGGTFFLCRAYISVTSFSGQHGHIAQSYFIIILRFLSSDRVFCCLQIKNKEVAGLKSCSIQLINLILIN